MYRNLILVITTSCLYVTGVVISSRNGYQQSADKEELTMINAKDITVYETGEIHLIDLENYRFETMTTLEENDKIIANLRSVPRGKTTGEVEMEKRITELEQLNVEMKSRMINFEVGNGADWLKFKKEYESDLGELQNGLKHLPKSYSEIK